MLSRIRVPSIWADGSGVAIFSLGLGPCGKAVTSLSTSSDAAAFHVTQICGDNRKEGAECKIFSYPWHTITGRIEQTLK